MNTISVNEIDTQQTLKYYYVVAVVATINSGGSRNSSGSGSDTSNGSSGCGVSNHVVNNEIINLYIATHLQEIAQQFQQRKWFSISANFDFNRKAPKRLGDRRSFGLYRPNLL